MSKPISGLGKGIDALISSDFNKGILEDAGERVQKLFIKDIQPLKDQPRKHFDDTTLQELASSIKQFGIVQPIIVSPQGSGYEIIAGERRWRAAKIAGLKQVPAIVREPKKQERLEIALIENVQRVDLSPLEQAVTIEKLHQEFSLSYSDIAKRLGKAPTTVNNIVRLLQLPETSMVALQKNQITEGHARSILALKDMPDKQEELLSLIIKNGWSVRQAEQFVISNKQGAQTQKQVEQKMATTTPKSESLSKRLNTPITIKRTARGGRIEIHFKDDGQLQDLLDNLSKQ